MVLTHKRTLPPDPNKFPATQLFLLGLVRVAEPIALTSILPYAWKLVLHYNVGDRSHASFYAGLLISAFSLSEALSGMFWGGLSDRLGRKPVLLMGCVGTIMSLLVVGFSPNFWVALCGRFLGGALNGNIGVIQTMVGELVINPKHEPKAYAIMPFVWSVGTILGPSIGGYFAEPAANFPGIAPEGSIFAKFPYLLPNLICSILMLVSILAGYFFLFETHPDMQPWSTPQDLQESNAETPLIPAQAGMTTPAANLAHGESYGTFNPVTEEVIEEVWEIKPDGTSRPPSLHSASEQKVFTKRVIMLTIALGIFTYHSMTYDALLPVFAQDTRVPADGGLLSAMVAPTATELGSFAGGLGLSVKDVGIVMSFNGLIALFVQALVFPIMASWLGIWRTFFITAVGHPVVYFIVPYLALLPPHLLYPGIYTCLAVRNFFSILAYPVLLILLKEAAPSSNCLGKINGLAASTGAGCRTIASPLAGWLYGLGTQIEFAPIAWWASALVALVGTLQAFFINREKDGPRHQVRTLAPCRLMSDEREHRDSVVHIKVQDNDPDSGYSTADELTPFASRVYKG